MSGESVFLDTAGWIALLNASDALHERASQLWRTLIDENHSVLLTDWIIAETGNGLARTPARERFTAAVQLMRSSPRVQLIFVTSELLERALTLYGERTDKTWGLVDCASFLIMRDNSLQDAFTTDRHFEQAGFRCLLPLL
ncbi:MAG TPA: PIN domain-containing protein [Tepidisphaeraceae bacterium]|jgi:predicted nucleic acid-binding protein